MGQVELRLSDCVRIARDVMARQVGEDVVMLDLARGDYFGLDSVGARVWQLMGEGKTLAEVCNVMMQEYEVSRETIEHDVTMLAEELAARGLIIPG
ncbi:MAG: hypothetical protein A3G25_13910 [Betaproteobacteria bacterium RIFCSPLOWO2_12_FULL_63_13]|nr:MAG: hypothetical protein A3G25_13910 [Betaproteobacteria bacterium RIFCSPLOWO2_12_FULL_63_13]